MLRNRLLALALLLPLAGCVSFGPKPPKTLLTLTPAATVAPGPARTSDDAHAVAVAIINVQPALANQRIMVQDGPNSIAYVKDGAWAANPGLLFRNLLAETIMATTGRYVPDQRNTGVQPDTRLSGQLVMFGLDAASHSAVVTFDGVISHGGSEKLQTRRFSASIPITNEDAPTVGAAIDQAANQVAGQVAAWIGG
jgi:cholesterol transport system auxiliary component